MKNKQTSKYFKKKHKQTPELFKKKIPFYVIEDNFLLRKIMFKPYVN